MNTNSILKKGTKVSYNGSVYLLDGQNDHKTWWWGISGKGFRTPLAGPLPIIVLKPNNQP
jgi:hypothetical protein